MVFDIESTGFFNKSMKTRNADIIQFAFLIFNSYNDQIEKAGNFYFVPSLNKISKGAYETHGITEELLYTYTTKTFEDFIPELRKLLSGVNTIIGHNIRMFDVEFLRTYKDEQLNNILNDIEIIDTMTDFTDKLYKITCDKKSYSWKKEWISLEYCYYRLLRNGLKHDTVMRSIKSTFNLEDSLDWFHNAAFDVYINYLIYLDLRGDLSC